MFKAVTWLPCSLFFAAGRTMLGITVLLMQLSVVLWPVASSWARQFVRETQMEKRLDELVRDYRVALPLDGQPSKRFAAAA